MKIAAHTMEYQGGRIVSHLQLRNYSALDYKEYKRIYEECFHDMRIALQRFPIECCGSREELERKKEEIYILEIDGKIIGSVAIYGNEIDDLVVEKAFKGWGMEQRYCGLPFPACKAIIPLPSFCMLRIGIKAHSKYI